MSIQINGTIQLAAERRNSTVGVSDEPLEFPFNASDWGDVERLVSFATVWHAYSETEETPDNLYVTILGVEDTVEFKFQSGATFRVAEIKQDAGRTTPDGETSERLGVLLSIGHVTFWYYLFKFDCVTPTDDGREIEAEAPDGLVHAVLWMGTAKTEAPAGGVVERASNDLKSYERKFTEAGTDALALAELYTLVLDVFDEADQAKKLASKLRTKMEKPLLSAMSRGAGTQRITTNGRTLSVSLDLYAGRAVEIFEDQAAREALVQDDGDHLIKETIPAQSWKKYLRDKLVDEDGVLPTSDEELAARHSNERAKLGAVHNWNRWRLFQAQPTELKVTSKQKITQREERKNGTTRDNSQS